MNEQSQKDGDEEDARMSAATLVEAQAPLDHIEDLES
jgi:hypothetical protein